MPEGGRRAEGGSGMQRRKNEGWGKSNKYSQGSAGVPWQAMGARISCPTFRPGWGGTDSSILHIVGRVPGWRWWRGGIYPREQTVVQIHVHVGSCLGICSVRAVC